MSYSLTTSESLFAINDDVEILYSGLSFFALSMFLMPLYYLIITVIHNKDLQTPNMTYKLMNLINLIQLCQGICHFITSPVLIFPRLLVKFEVIVRIVGCIMNSCWIADLPVMALLAICRIFIFCNIINPKKFHALIKVILIVILSWIFFIILAGCITQNMKLTPPWWGYDFDVPYASMFDTLEICLSFPCLVISYLSYLIIIYLIYGKRNFKSTLKSRKNEISILLQYTFVTVYVSFMVIIWHPALFSIFSFINMSNRRNQAIINGLWILHCFVNPMMMLIFNRSIRDDVASLLNLDIRCGKQIQPAVIVSVFSVA